MSYILDALTKSQQQRVNNAMPSPDTPQLVATPARGSPMGHAGSAALILAAAALGFAIHALQGQGWAGLSPPAPQVNALPPPGAGEPVQSATQGMSVAKQATSHSAPPPLRPPAIFEPPARPASHGFPVDTSYTAVSKPAPERTTRPRAAPDAGPATPVHSAELPPELLALRGPGVEVSTDTERLVNELASIAERQTRVPPPLPASADLPRGAATAPGAITTPAVDPAPPNERFSVPPMTVNAHVYDEVAARRMVIINMRRYGEGETLREGPRIEAITKAGVELSFQSHRFQIGSR